MAPPSLLLFIVFKFNLINKDLGFTPSCNGNGVFAKHFQGKSLEMQICLKLMMHHASVVFKCQLRNSS